MHNLDELKIKIKIELTKNNEMKFRQSDRQSDRQTDRQTERHKKSKEQKSGKGESIGHLGRTATKE